MKTLLLLAGFATVLLVAIAAPAASAKRSPGEPDPLSKTRSIGDVIAGAAGKPVHIIYVHGMRAEGPGAIRPFLAKLAREIGHTGSLDRTQQLQVDLGSRPADARIGSTRIWRTDTEWKASFPFVDRYVLTGGAGETVFLDEINWWPLLFPLKCRFLVLPEHDLSGADEEHLRLCARRDEPYYPWISSDELDDALNRKPLSGGGVWINRSLKQQIMNWGLSDAVIALGPIQTYIRMSLDQAFRFAETEPQGPAAREYVVISESLGSFAVMDAYDRNAESVKAVLEQTHNLYFLANQFALLELGRVQGIAPQAGQALMPEGLPPEGGSALSGLRSWAGTGDALFNGATTKQVIAFNDPSDILTYRVPPIPGATVSNVSVRNSTRWLGVFVHPVKAHSGHIENPRVVRMMLDKSQR